MLSFKARIFRFILKNRHLLQGHLRPQAIDENTPVRTLREQVRRGAERARIPADVRIEDAAFPAFHAEWVIPASAPEDRLILYVHGGGFVTGNSRDHRGWVSKLVRRVRIKALLFDYRLAPEHPFPCAMEDCAAVYKWLLAQGYDPKNILAAADSAGGCILLSAFLKLKDEGVPLPAAMALISPCTDPTLTSPSVLSKQAADPATPPGANRTYTKHYIGAADPRAPYLSPLFGDLKGLPSVMIQVGADETLLDDSTRFADFASRAGVDVTLRVWEGLFHCFPLLAPMFPEATRAMDEMDAFLHRHLPK